MIDAIIAANPGQVAAFRGGKEGLLGFFVGQVMKETGGTANPRVVSELVRAKLARLTRVSGSPRSPNRRQASSRDAPDADLARDAAVRGGERPRSGTRSPIASPGTPLGDLHGYLAHAPQIVLILASLALLGLAADARARRRSPVPLASLGVVAFVAQEHLERLVHTGHVPFLLTSPVLWLGIALQVPLAVAVWLVARRLAEDIAAPVRAGCPAASRRLRFPLVAARPRSPSSRPRRRGASGPRSSRLLLTPFRRAIAWRGTRRSRRTSCVEHSSLAIALVAIAVPRRPPAHATASSPSSSRSPSSTAARSAASSARPSRRAGPFGSSSARTSARRSTCTATTSRSTVKKGVPTVIQFVAKVPGRFELELHPMDVLLAQLTVKP